MSCPGCQVPGRITFCLPQLKGFEGLGRNQVGSCSRVVDPGTLPHCMFNSLLPHTTFTTDNIRCSSDLVEPVFLVQVMAAPQSDDGYLVLPSQLQAFQLVVHYLSSFAADACSLVGGSSAAYSIAADSRVAKAPCERASKISFSSELATCWGPPMSAWLFDGPTQCHPSSVRLTQRCECQCQSMWL